MKNLSDKNKIILLMVGAVIVMVLSGIVLFMSWKDSKKEAEPEPDERIENMDLTQFDNEDVIQDSIVYNLDKKGKNRGCKLLSKYSEDYVSVMQWMLSTVCNKLNAEGFTIDEYVIPEGQEESEAIEVDGLEKYGTAENYLTEFLNNNPDADISDILLTYCPDEYYALRNTYILGKEEYKEYGESESQMMYTTLLEAYCSGDYDKVVGDIDDLLASYKLTLPYNYPLCNLYQDAKSAITYDMDTSAIIYGLDYMHSAETYLSNFLKLSNSEKADAVLDKESLCPFAHSHGIITNVSETNQAYVENYKQKYSSYYTDGMVVKIIDFYIGDMSTTDNTYQAYMMCDYKDNVYHVVSIKSTGNKTPYKTAAQIKGIGVKAPETEEESSETNNTTYNFSGNRFGIPDDPDENMFQDDEYSEENESQSDYNYNSDYNYDYDDENYIYDSEYDSNDEYQYDDEDDYYYDNDDEDDNGAIIVEEYIED